MTLWPTRENVFVTVNRFCISLCRTQGGRLHLVENVGKIALADITLVEDPNEDDARHTDDEGEWILYIQVV